jgi:hypothetical protein
MRWIVAAGLCDGCDQAMFMSDGASGGTPAAPLKRRAETARVMAAAREFGELPGVGRGAVHQAERGARRM